MIVCMYFITTESCLNSFIIHSSLWAPDILKWFFSSNQYSYNTYHSATGNINGWGNGWFRTLESITVQWIMRERAAGIALDKSDNGSINSIWGNY